MAYFMLLPSFFRVFVTIGAEFGKIALPPYAFLYNQPMKIIECVPNFSEGQNPAVVQAIAGAIRSVPQVKLLDIDGGFHAHRTVMTFAGGPHAVAEAAFRAVKTAAAHIDMSQHRGEHPRIGATDVCPLIPVAGVEMEEVVAISKALGARIGAELQLPVYLYEHSASSPERRNLAWLRKGEYEGLEQKMLSGHFAPDYGPATFNPKSGTCIVGAREFLIAYNINLATKDVQIARDIAAEIRESGDNKQPGLLKKVKAIGWYIKEFDQVQVSMNLTDYKTTPVHTVFEAVKTCAARHNVEVTGSELVGMIPLGAIAPCGEYFLKKNKLHHHLPHTELVAYAAQYLGLNDSKPFDPARKVIEFALQE